MYLITELLVKLRYCYIDIEMLRLYKVVKNDILVLLESDIKKIVREL